MPRPLRPDGRLQVRLFVTGKYRYAATQATARDPETGRYVPRKTITARSPTTWHSPPMHATCLSPLHRRTGLHFLPIGRCLRPSPSGKCSRHSASRSPCSAGPRNANLPDPPRRPKRSACRSSKKFCRIQRIK